MEPDYVVIGGGGVKHLDELPPDARRGANENAFKGGYRIDLTLIPKEKMKTDFIPDSLSMVWLDKDGLFSGIEPPSDRDYLIRKPTEKEFAECCNEFWWVCTYVSKGLRREEIMYAKAMMEGPVRQCSCA
jgi:aminoglycoside 6-adenylyltransferase